MRFFIDTEFHEGFNKPLFGKNRHFIDLISIGIVSENGDEYYAISRDFDIKAAWNSWQPRTGQGDRNNHEPREYWLRENVLKPIFDELLMKDEPMLYHAESVYCFTLSRFKELIKKYGKSNDQIASEIKDFVIKNTESSFPKFYGYYADYDWVLFCSLYGKMINLPIEFPYFCYDIKQIMNEKLYSMEDCIDYIDAHSDLQSKPSEKELIDIFIKSDSYPVISKEHHALEDAKFNLSLLEYLESF